MFWGCFTGVLIHVEYCHIMDCTNAVKVGSKFFWYCANIYHRLSLHAVLIFQSKSLLKCTIYVIKCCSFFFRNINILKQQLSGLWEQENHLTLVPGYTGNIAKVIQFQLCLVMNIAVLLAVFLSFDVKYTKLLMDRNTFTLSSPNTPLYCTIFKEVSSVFPMLTVVWFEFFILFSLQRKHLLSNKIANSNEP